ncbi:MAG: glycosyltransferase family 4 protein [bacterium]|nr:glycosyltransferase family 4 protein [bacterium]
MNIIEISAVFPPYRGGIGNVCRQNARMLASAGHEVTVLTPRYKRLRSLTRGVETQEGYTVRRLTPWLEFGNAAIIPQINKYIHTADVVHLHVPFIGLGREFVKLKNKKLLVTYHMDLVGRDWKRTFFTRYTEKMLPQIIQRADKVIVSSLDYGLHSNISPQMATDTTKFIELPNSVDTLLYYPKTVNQTLMAHHGITADDHVVLFVGGLDTAHYFKGVQHLLEAFELIVHSEQSTHEASRFKLIIVGQGDMQARYQNMVGQMGLADKIIFAGNPPDETLADYYNMCDVMVLPSIDSSEAFGVVLVEAMACGKPVITTDLPGPRSVVENGSNGFLVKPKNSAMLAEKIYAILSDPALADQMGKRSKALVDEKYSYSVVSKRLEELVIHL